MRLWELMMIAVGLSADALAVALCKGLSMRRLNVRHAAIIALFFGGFQAAMPMAGWLLGSAFKDYIEAYDHWVAFGVLACIGGKMIFDFFKGESCPVEAPDKLDLRQLTSLAVATSIDAFVVGIALAFSGVAIMPAATLIGATTFALSFAGVAIGCWFGARFRNKAELIGGAVLIGIGVKILLEGVGAM